MNIRKNINDVTRMSFQHKCWLVYFFFSSFIVWSALRIVAMRRLAKKMGEPINNRRISTLATPKQTKLGVEMGDLLSKVANNTPWNCTCLAQALCLKALLNHYKIPSVLYLGALIDRESSDQPQTMKAHAWIDVSSETVIGGPQHRQYQVVGGFASLSFD